MTEPQTQLTLFLLRHGKAKDKSRKDFDRPLTEFGRKQVAQKGLIINKRCPAINVILCSSALRTRETLQYLNLNPASTCILVEEDLYLADALTILNSLTLIGQGNSVLIIGHNPGLHQFACDLLPLPTAPRTDQELHLTSVFPTCALAEFKLSCHTWAEVRPHKGQLIAYHE